MAALPQSLPRICVALGCSTPEELNLAAHREYKDGGTFLEFRLDYLRDPLSGIALLRDLRQTYPDLAILATCRHKRNHGHFGGSPERQFDILADAGRGAQRRWTLKWRLRSRRRLRWRHCVPPLH